MSHKLNPQQEEAAKAPGGPLLIVAGAGTGKTTTLTARLINLIESGVPAHKICAITFTNKAAREMFTRCQASLLRRGYGGQASVKCQGAFIGTFHGLGANILRQEARLLGRNARFVIFDDHDSFDLIKKIVKKKLWNGGDDDSSAASQEKPSFFARRISEIKNTDSALQKLRLSEKQKDKLALEVYALYESRLKENNAFDFDDLIEKVVSLFQKHPEALEKHRSRFEAILVDEYQDVNPKQYELVNLLAGEHKNISVVGDDEQLIYGWRYADLKIFLGFEKDWPGAQIRFLEENYRSTANIIKGASSVASNNNYRRPKNLWTKNQKGESIKVFGAADENNEAEWIAKQISNFRFPISNEQTTAVLYRTNAQSRAIEQALIRNKIPYRIFGGLRFYERKEIKDVIAALRYATNKDEISFDRLEKNFSKKKLSGFEETIRLAKSKKLKPVQWIESFLEATDYLGYLERNFENYEEKQENIGELLNFAKRFDDVGRFLEEITLMQPADSVTSNKGQGTRDGENETHLMTIHLAKGLEFDRVFIAGCSEGLLPHAMSMENEYQMEEERRLMYVAMTRAKRELCIGFHNTPSRFISEIPEELTVFEGQNATDVTSFEEDYVTLD
ncbi:MAG: UvrD-helicase domain-containing protein [Candidatus Liptonbacteria bacterium]|nr:UvrD-helicase domain-containing protein [Candidatus Liptonbacteria bacterium]